MVAADPQASEDEESSLRNLVSPIRVNVELQTIEQGRIKPVVVQQLTCIDADPSTIVYNVVLETGHTYFENGFCVFDMFPNLAQYPRMFKFLHLLWRQCATQIDDHFDDIITPGSIDRHRLESLADSVKQAILHFCLNSDRLFSCKMSK